MVATPLKGVVLAGGSSRRMGRDKAALEIAGQSLLGRAVEALRAAVADVSVSVRAEQADEASRVGYALVQDQFADIGPAAGILSAHLQAPECAWFVIACDMPLLDEQMLCSLVEARDQSMDATAWAADAAGEPEPLCAIYEPSTLAAFLAQVQSGENPSPRAWLARARVKLLSTAEPEKLASANTPAELDRLANTMGLQKFAVRRKQDDQ